VNGTIAQAAALLARHVALRTRLRQAMVDNLNGQPRAASFESDRTTGHDTILFCWDHEQDPTACHKQGLMCQGDTIATHTDTTGEAATNPDRARSDQKELERIEKQLISLAHLLAHLDDRYLPARLPDKAGRAKLATPGSPGCDWCWDQAKTWSPPTTKQPTTVAGNLLTAKLCCRGHYDYIRTIGRDPSTSETQAWVRTGRWPKQKVTP
jgi:hypothetical protein